MEIMANFLNGMLLRCPVKAWTGMDCPGCGFQRAFVALLHGDFSECWHHYPPLIPFLVTMLMVVVAVKTKIPYRMALLGGALVVTCVFIATNYAIKMF